MRSTKGILILSFIAIIWGSSFILMKRGLDVYSPLQISAIRMFLASVVLLPFGWQQMRAIAKKKIKYALVVGFIGSGIPSILFPLAQTQISSALAGILNALVPLFTLILGVLFFQVKSSTNQATGIAIGLIGAVLLVANESLSISSGGIFYPLLIIVAGVCYATSTNTLRKYLYDVPVVGLTTLSYFLVLPAAIVLGIYTDVVDTTMHHEKSWEALFYIGILSVLGTAFAGILFFYVTQRTSALKASSVTYLIPFIAILWGFIDGEPIGLIHFVGLLLILSGLYLIHKKKSISVTT